MHKPHRFSKARAYGSRKGAWGRSAKHWTRLFRAPTQQEYEYEVRGTTPAKVEVGEWKVVE